MYRRRLPWPLDAYVLGEERNTSIISKWIRGRAPMKCRSGTSARGGWARAATIFRGLRT